MPIWHKIEFIRRNVIHIHSTHTHCVIITNNVDWIFCMASDNRTNHKQASKLNWNSNLLTYGFGQYTWRFQWIYFILILCAISVCCYCWFNTDGGDGGNGSSEFIFITLTLVYFLPSLLFVLGWQILMI